MFKLDVLMSLVKESCMSYLSIVFTAAKDCFNFLGSSHYLASNTYCADHVDFFSVLLHSSYRPMY